MSAGTRSGARFISASGDRTGALAFQRRFSQPSDLFYMMQAVNEMKLSPLCGGERPEDRMVEQLAARPKLFFATCDVVIHFGDFQTDLGQNLLWRQSPRTR